MSLGPLHYWLRMLAIGQSNALHVVAIYIAACLLLTHVSCSAYYFPPCGECPLVTQLSRLEMALKLRNTMHGWVLHPTHRHAGKLLCTCIVCFVRLCRHNQRCICQIL